MTKGRIIHITGKLLAMWTSGKHTEVIKELATLGDTRSAHLMMTVAVGLAGALGDYDRDRFFNRLLGGYEV